MKAGIDCIAGGSVRMRQAIRDRISRRTFTEEVLQEKEIKQIKEKILAVESGVRSYGGIPVRWQGSVCGRDRKAMAYSKMYAHW